MIDLFLASLALVWIIVASYQDLKRREVENWLSFSLIVFSLAYISFYSVINLDWAYFLYHLLGLGIFIGLGFLFYYSRVFAGGDAKLIMGLGIVLSISSLKTNLLSYASFIILLLGAGAVYGLFYSLAIALKNKKVFLLEFKKNFKVHKMQTLYFLAIALISLVIPFYFKENILFFYPLLLILFPLLLIYGKSVETCLILLTPYQKLTVGDWLYQKVKLGNRLIKPHWEGLTEEQVYLLKKHKKSVVIKNGIPFVPAFLIAFIIFLVLGKSGWSFW